ncbi:MAG: FkbM family methyltransferase [Hyphomonadaceae bacterium]|nr:FkbM family methyltransferase [Hyphomonadaceae bacterium]
MMEALAIFGRSPAAAAQFTVSEIGGGGDPRQLDFGPLRIWVRPRTTDLKVVRSCMLGEFDAILAMVRSEHDLIIDAGGYIGITSILFAQKFPKATIVCLEPNDENYEMAERNCAPWPNIRVLKCALAPRSGSVMLKDRGTGHWGFTVVDNDAQGRILRNVGETAAITVDELLSSCGKSGVDLLKLDIEGGEYALLRDKPAWIHQCGVIVAEMHDRICPGATRAFINATEGRTDVWTKGEKRVSIRADLADAAAKVDLAV